MTTFKRHSFKNVNKNMEQGEVSNVAGGVVNVTTIFFRSLSVSCEVWHIFTLWPSKSPPNQEKWKCTYIQKDLWIIFIVV